MKKAYSNVILWDSSMPMAKLCDVITDGALIDSVVAAGTARNSVYDGKGKTALLPGFVNAHGHAAMSMLRGLGEELPLMEWLEKRIWPAEERLNGDVVETGTNVALMEMLSTGTTCFADMYFFMDRVAEASIKAGMRCGLSRGIIGDADGKKLAESLTLAKDYNGAAGLVNIQLAPHAPYTLTMETVAKIAEAASENSLGVQFHWLESKTDWALCDMNGKMTPEEYLTQSGLTRVKHLLLAHCLYVNPQSVDFYAKENITFAHNPKSNLKLGSGVAQIVSYLKAGISVAMGTDGAASNNRLDMWDELRFAALIHKGVNYDPTCLCSAELFKMATVAGAKALGFDHTGLIKEGYTADMMLVDLDRPHYTGWDTENLPGYLVYAGSSADVKATVVAGEMLYADGEFMTIDRESVAAEAVTARKILTQK